MGVFSEMLSSVNGKIWKKIKLYKFYMIETSKSKGWSVIFFIFCLVYILKYLNSK